MKLRNEGNPENIRSIFFVSTDLTPLEQEKNKLLKEKLNILNKDGNKLFQLIPLGFPESVESSVAYVTNVLVSATCKFIPSCVPRLRRPTPWWNRRCEAAWQRKMKFWHNPDDVRFHQASLSAAHIYSSAIQSYQARLRKTLGDCTGSKHAVVVVADKHDWT